MSTLLHDITAFREQHGLSKTRFGQLALNDKAFHSQLEAGRFLFPRTEAKIRKFMAEYRQPDKSDAILPDAQPAQDAA